MRIDRFLKACNLEATDATPIWIMRQAGRYLSEYREFRKKYDFLTLCKTPDLATQVTLLPINKFELDAAILFADIMLPLEGMGIDFDIVENVGPVIENPVRNMSQIESLKIMRPERDVSYLLETIRMVRGELSETVPLIGFSGAPFTLASYIIEGKPSKNYLLTKQMMMSEPQTWHALMSKLSDMVCDYLRAQIEAGAQAIQLFDSWVGALNPTDYDEFVFPYTKRIFDSIEELGVPKIHFGVVTSTLLPLIRETGADVIGVDWRTPLDQGWDVIGRDKAIQGNLDPISLFAPQDVLKARVQEILNQAAGAPGHIFNLGHGILPNTPPENVQFLVDLVHELTA
jgi:uroporphyrinogen decarboxylase